VTAIFSLAMKRDAGALLLVWRLWELLVQRSREMNRRTLRESALRAVVLAKMTTTYRAMTTRHV
jgi:hypothetical protein